MQEYRKIHDHSVLVLAVQLTPQNQGPLMQMVGGVGVSEQDPFDKEKLFVGINVPTFEGRNKRCSEGDWILMLTGGYFDVCKDGIFQRTYELLDRDT